METYLKNLSFQIKINMGMDKKYHFEDADVDMFPEELSAEVLKELKNSPELTTQKYMHT